MNKHELPTVEEAWDALRATLRREVMSRQVLHPIYSEQLPYAVLSGFWISGDNMDDITPLEDAEQEMEAARKYEEWMAKDE